MCGFQSTMGLAVWSWGRDSLCVTEGSDSATLWLVFCQQIGFYLFPCLPDETLTESWSHNALAFLEEHRQKQNPGRGFRLFSGRCQGSKKRNADIYSWAIVTLNNAMAWLQKSTDYWWNKVIIKIRVISSTALLNMTKESSRKRLSQSFGAEQLWVLRKLACSEVQQVKVMLRKGWDFNE